MTMDIDPSISPFLSGVFAPIGDELDVDDLRVTGEIPAALDGTFLRNGPNPQFAPIGRYHVFDGDGMVHAVDLSGGRARYRNRWIESRGLLAERRAGRARYGGLSEFVMPDPDLVAEGGMLKNTSNTNVIRHAGRILALMEAAPPTELGADLSTLGEFDYDGKLVGAMTAHPKLDPSTGELLFFGYGPFPPYLRFHVADAAGNLVRSEVVDLPNPVMMHDFGVTQSRVVFFDLPALFDVPAMLAGDAAVRWAPELGARIGVLDRAPGSDVRWFELEPFYLFHLLNAYDDGDAVVIEGCRSPRLNVAFGDEVLAERVEPKLHRWRIDLASGVVSENPLDERPGDFPRINDAFGGLPARYGYLGNIRPDGVDLMFDGVVKHDLQTGTSTVASYGDATVSGEPVFAADPDRDDEDGGWLLNLVTDTSAGTSDLVILDAQGLDEVARVHMPRRVPFGFHGNWLPA